MGFGGRIGLMSGFREAGSWTRWILKFYGIEPSRTAGLSDLDSGRF
jgi:hypothetical protein